MNVADAGRLDARGRVLWAALFAAVIAVMWLRYAGTSFWLDETATAYVVRGGFADLLRGVRFQGQTPAYFVVAWIFRMVFGRSELALRLPSIIAMGIATFFTWRLALRLIGIRAARTTALLFVGIHAVAFSAIDARPYALGLASLTGAGLALVRWLDEGQTRDGVVFAIASALTIYITFVFAPVSVVFGLYAVYRVRGDSPVGIKGLIVAGVSSLVLAAPALGVLVGIFGRADILRSQPGLPTIKDALFVLTPPSLSAGIALGAAMAIVGYRSRLRIAEVRWPALIFGIAWAVVQVGVLFALSRVVAAKFFSPRYALAATPGFALASAAAIAAMTKERARVAIAVTAVAVSAWAYDGGLHTLQDWRGVSAAVNRAIGGEDTTVLINTGFLAAQPVSAEKEAFLLAPVAAYPMDGDVVLLPFVNDEASRVQLDRFLKRLPLAGTRVLLVTGFESKPYPYMDAVSSVLSPRGFTARRVFAHRRTQVFEFTR